MEVPIHITRSQKQYEPRDAPESPHPSIDEVATTQHADGSDVIQVAKRSPSAIIDDEDDYQDEKRRKLLYDYESDSSSAIETLVQDLPRAQQ